ncbi:MAG: helix-turn-helix transcriptional regulator [Flavobacteriales bacterium]|nr:helix-turn-helix transcriptional regulator [Flavobacteriales bacterium]
MKKLVRNIRIIREIRNLRQGGLGRAIGYSQKHISRIEKGEVQLGDECIKRIAETLNVSPQKLIDLDLKSFLK